MKLTLWQQFSSNHSSHFTIIGVFPSSEAAQQAANQLLELITEIDNWFEQAENAEAKARREQYYETAPVSDPEKHISEKYGIPWYSYSLDWIYNRNIIVAEQFVLIYPGETWQGAKPLADLLAKLGSQTAIQGYVGVNTTTNPRQSINANLTFNIDCLAPDESAAQELVKAVETYLNLTADDPMGTHDLPWVAKLPSYSAFSGEVSHMGREIHFRNAYFSPNPAIYFPMFLAYLREKDYEMTHCEFLVDLY